MKKLIMFFYTIQSGDKIHPFAIEEIECFRKDFDEIHLFCLDSKNGFNELNKYENLFIHPMKRYERYTCVISLFKELLSKRVRSEIRTAYKNGDLSLQYFKSLFKIIIPGRKMYNLAKKTIDKSKWYIESYWFDSSAYAASLLKHKFKDIKAITRAHGIEIDPIRNKFMKYEMKKYVLDNIDSVCFISLAGRRRFERIIKDFYGEDYSNKYTTFRLGVEKKYKNNSVISKDKVLRIVSCSRMNPVKRLPLLAKALSHIKKIKIQWTHFGSGEDYDKIVDIVKKYDSNIKCDLKGNLSNNEIHKYYSNNAIDVFINVSYSEGIPVSIMESFAYAIPAIATNVGGTSEIVDDNCGILIPENISEVDLANVLIDFYNMDNKAKIRMRKCAFKKWMDYYSKEKNKIPFKKFLLDEV